MAAVEGFRFRFWFMVDVVFALDPRCGDDQIDGGGRGFGFWFWLVFWILRGSGVRSTAAAAELVVVAAAAWKTATAAKGFGKAARSQRGAALIPCGKPRMEPMPR
jgi:hypothetical protein